jgi:hypothetical protein
MMESEWLAAGDPEAMVEFLRGKVGVRRWRLLVCALARVGWPLLRSQRSRKAVEVAERFADGLAPKKEMTAAGAGAQQAAWAASPLGPGFKNHQTAAAHDLARYAAYANIFGVLSYVLQSVPVAGIGAPLLRALIQDIFGNLFCPLPERHFPAHVVGLAQSIYAAFPEVSDDYLVLADALADLGEEQAAAHCREKMHARGCHVVDLLLGRK